jgi:perosamine synthetase
MGIPLFRNTWDEKDIEYVTKVIKRGMYWANGPEIVEFEKRIAEFTGVKFCLTFNSGTSALHSVLLALDVRDHEVIVPSFTFIATANSAIMAGGIPVFADIEEETFGLDVDDVNEKISDKTKVILPIHYGGCACSIKALAELAEDHELFLVEDAAESLGAKLDNKMAGSFGNAAMFSFTPTKVISTGEGGVIVTDNKDTYEKLKLIRSHGRVETAEYFSSTEYMDYISLGYNFRIPSICAAQGLAQLEKIEAMIKRRRELANKFTEMLSPIPALRTPIEPENRKHIYQMYSILVNEGKEKRDGLQKYLTEHEISSKVYFEPIHKTKYYQQELGYDIKLDTTEEISNKILSIPMFPGLTEAEQELIINNIQEFFK